MDKTNYNEIIQKWIEQVELNCNQNAELTLKYCTDIIEYGIKIKDNALIAFGYYYSGVVYYTLNDGTLFYEAITNALSYLNRVQDWKLMAKCYNFLGIASMNRGNVAVALDYYINAMKYCEKANADNYDAIVSINMGALYIQCGRYADAITMMKYAAEVFTSHKEEESYHDYMMCAYQNMAKAYLLQGNLEEAKECFQKIENNHAKYCDFVDIVTVLCTQTMYYHVAGDDENCEKTIDRINKETSANMPIMDMFDDYYDYCKVLLDRDKEEEFWHVMEIMEPMVKSVDITNLLLRMIALKMRFYRKHGKNADYLKAAGLYFELSERAEFENRAIMNSIINLRTNLEEANREREQAELRNQLLQEKSETDPLTNLNNRFRLNEYSEMMFKKALKEGLSLAVEILDLDDFKGYNDHYGHQLGDECLVKVADTIKTMETEHGAFVARYGGDEFILLYEGITKEEAIAYSEELRRKIIENAIPHARSKVSKYVTISQGMCWDIPIEGNRMWDFLHAADDMLYRVKQKQRNNYCIGNLKETEESIVMGKTYIS